jgi:DHA2 family multidrug resistance protein
MSSTGHHEEAHSDEKTAIVGSKFWITLTVVSAAIMSLLDISIVNVALNDIRAGFGTPLDQIAWVSTGYMMANICIIPLTGWFQKRFGFKRYYATSIVIFTIASALCGLSWNLPSLVVFRMLQGLGGGAIIPTSQAILFSRYPKHEHGMANAFFALGAITAPLLGPTVGGYLIDWFNWHWIFFINIPIGVIAVGLVLRHIEEPEFKADDAPVDWTGLGLLAAGMVSLQYVLEEGTREGWWEATHIVVLSIIALLCLVTFVVHELETPFPVVDFRIFKNVSYLAASSLNFLMGTALFAGNLLFSLYCSNVMHYTALDIGTLMLQGSCVQILVMPMVGRFGTKYDARILIAIGILTMTYSLWLNAHLTNEADRITMIAPLFTRAVGLGLMFIPLSMTALSDLPQKVRGNATGLFALTRELGGSIGTAWMSNALSVHTAQYTNNLAEHVSVYSPITQTQMQMLDGVGRMTTQPHLAGLAIMKMRIANQAMISSFNVGFMSLGSLFIVAMTLLIFLKRQGKGASAPVGH